MAEFDLYGIEDRLREYDPELFRRIDFDHKRGLHRIICYDPILREEYIAFTVKPGELDNRTVKEYMEIHPRNGFNLFRYFDEQRAIKERRDENRIRDMATDLAENILSSFRMKPSRSID